MKANSNVVVKHVYDVTYNKGTVTDPHTCTYLADVDFFTAYYFFASILESKPGILNAEIIRYAVYSDSTRQRVCPVNTANYDDLKRDALLGLNVDSGESLNHLIRSDRDAELIAKGIEIGIQRCVSYTQSVAANTSDATLAAYLNEVTEDLLIEAPTAYIKWKSIVGLCTDIDVHHANNRTLKALVEKAYTPTFDIEYTPIVNDLFAAIRNLKG